MTTRPIPDTALDDRIAYVGTSGSGKTYAAGTAVEQLLASGARVVIVDPLDVWWGLRLRADGTPSPHNVVILGGAHGDLALNQDAGGAIGAAVAGSSQSAIVSLGGLPSKAAERRFMRAFLEAIYQHATGEPFHLIFDEADLWAPQRATGETATLLGRMEEIIRRGRVNGFIPWLITQRPAVIAKDVLSQMDGMVAMKLTGAHDRKAIEDWIGASVDTAGRAKIIEPLARFQRGDGILWLPARGILEQVQFPAKATYDSSRTPSRGEPRRNVRLQPIDIEGVRTAIAPKPAEPAPTKATKNIPQNIPVADPAVIEAAEQRGYERGKADGYAAGRRDADADWRGRLATLIVGPEGSLEEIATIARPPIIPASSSGRTPDFDSGKRGSSPRAGTSDASIAPARQKILDAIAWLNSIGHASPDKTQIAIMAGYSHTSGAYNNSLGALRTAGLLDYPEPGRASLTAAGKKVARKPAGAPTHQAVFEKVAAMLSPAQTRILRALCAKHPRTVSKADVGAAVDASATSGAFNNNLGRLRSLGLITYPSPGMARADDRLFPEIRS